MSDVDANETNFLLPRTSAEQRKKLSAGVMARRITIIVFLAGLAWSGIIFQNEVNKLTEELESERARIDELGRILEAHAKVIERFSSSVTNSDVMEKLTGLESDLYATKMNLRNELEIAKDEVAQKLQDTLFELNATVSKAEQDISEEVERVKKDVEHYVIATQDQFSMENSFMVYQLAGTFTLLSCLISMWHMTAHIRRMNQPDVQRKILAILWMSPIYAITSWFSLVFQSAEGYLAIIKDGYEAYVIYQFLSFCIAVLGKGNRSAVVDLLARRADHLTPPFRLLGIFEVCGCCKPAPYESNRALADDILLQCQFFAMQFVFFRPLTTTAMVVLKKLNYYGLGEGPMDYKAPQFYITIIQNVSIFTAFTGLLKFYHAVDKDLAWCRPFAKFLCIKCVVFMTFWQGLAISVLARTTDVGGQDADEWAQSAQNFLICLEMLLFSIAHFYCFPTEEWKDGYRVKHSEGKFGDSLALADFLQDLKLILTSNGHQKKKRRPSNQPTIYENGESDDEGSTPFSTATSRDSEDSFSNRRRQSEEEFIAKALEESLGLAADDPDIAEAKRRLIASKILSPDMFDDDDDDSFASDAEREIRACLGSDFDKVADEEKGNLMDFTDYTENGDANNETEYDDETGHDLSCSAYDVSCSAYDESCSTYDPQCGIYSNVKYEEPLEANETTSLLLPTSIASQQLRPSIFTRVATLCEEEQLNETDQVESKVKDKKRIIDTIEEQPIETIEGQSNASEKEESNATEKEESNATHQEQSKGAHQEQSIAAHQEQSVEIDKEQLKQTDKEQLKQTDKEQLKETDEEHLNKTKKTPEKLGERGFKKRGENGERERLARISSKSLSM